MHDAVDLRRLKKWRKLSWTRHSVAGVILSDHFNMPLRNVHRFRMGMYLQARAA
jgi:hypothetical protein